MKFVWHGPPCGRQVNIGDCRFKKRLGRGCAEVLEKGARTTEYMQHNNNSNSTKAKRLPQLNASQFDHTNGLLHSVMDLEHYFWNHLRRTEYTESLARPSTFKQPPSSVDLPTHEPHGALRDKLQQ